MVELLIVIAVIGILASIVVPAYISYKHKAYNSSALSYIQFVSKAEENYWLSAQNYISAPPGDGPSASGVLPNASVPSGVGYVIGVFPVSGSDSATGVATGNNYVAFAGHRNGNKVYSVGSGNESQIQWRKQKPGTASAAADAKSENISQPLPAGWGAPL